MQGKTNWFGIMVIFTGVYISVGFPLIASSGQSKKQAVQFCTARSASIPLTFRQDAQLRKQRLREHRDKTPQLRKKERNLHVTCVVRHGSDPNPADGRSCFSTALSPWSDLEKLCWAQQNTDLRWAGFKVDNRRCREGAIPRPITGNVQKGTADLDEGVWGENLHGKTAKESLTNQ